MTGTIQFDNWNSFSLKCKARSTAVQHWTQIQKEPSHSPVLADTKSPHTRTATMHFKTDGKSKT